jgi:hypothetical protein
MAEILNDQPFQSRFKASAVIFFEQQSPLKSLEPQDR